VAVGCTPTREAAVPAAERRCRISSQQTRLSDVSVSAAGLRFTLGLEGVSARIEVTQAQSEARLDVLTPLRFTATYPKASLAFRVAASTEWYGGRVRLGQGAAPSWRDIRGDEMLLSLEPSLGVAVKQPLAIACSRLGLSDGTPYSTPHPERAGVDAVGTGGDFVPFYLEPLERDPLEVRYPGGFAIKQRRPGWLLLAVSWEDGSRLQGWTPERHATHEINAVGGWGLGQSGGPFCGRSDAPRLIRVTLHDGAAIAASPAGPVWAHAAQDLEAEAFPPEPSDEWIRVATVPGLIAAPCSEHEHIWARARDVSVSH